MGSHTPTARRASRPTVATNKERIGKMPKHTLQWQEFRPEDTTARELLLAVGRVATDNAVNDALLEEAEKVTDAIKGKVDRQTYFAADSFIHAAIIEAADAGVRVGIALLATAAGNFRMGDNDAWVDRAIEYAGLLDYHPQARYDPLAALSEEPIESKD